VRTKPEDAEFTGNQHFRDDLLVFAAFKIRARMDRVPARPARGGKKCVQAIGIGALVSIRNYLPATLIAIAIGDPPFYDACIKWDFEFGGVSVNVVGPEPIRLIEGA
jgi:hypothetical protein